jgi:MoaA/NifB/PqqE/SkfB family radical SAM enzyme
MKKNVNKLVMAALDGASDETYIKYRRKGNFTNVVNAVKYIKEAKADRSSKYPRIILQFIVMKHNEHEVDEIRRIARSLMGV